MEAKEKFKPGDLVAYMPKLSGGYSALSLRPIGIVVPNDPQMEQIALFPQITVLMFEGGQTRLFWPSYLQLISAIEGEQT